MNHRALVENFPSEIGLAVARATLEEGGSCPSPPTAGNKTSMPRGAVDVAGAADIGTSLDSY